MKDRIFQLLDEKKLTLTAFADEIGVERSTMSHIKAGRSNPSLDVAQKILERYPEVSADWLISGRGAMYRQKNDSREPNLFDDFNLIASSTSSNTPSREQKKPQQMPPVTEKPPMRQRSLSRIIVFYDDGTFEEMDKK